MAQILGFAATSLESNASLLSEVLRSPGIQLTGMDAARGILMNVWLPAPSHPSRLGSGSWAHVIQHWRPLLLLLLVWT